MSIQDTFISLQNSFKNIDPKVSGLATSMSYYAIAGKVADVLLLSNPIGLYGGAVYGACFYVVHAPLESFINTTFNEFSTLWKKESPNPEELQRMVVLVGTYALTKLITSTATLALASFAGVQLSFIGSLTISTMPFLALPLIVLPIIAVTTLVALPILFPKTKLSDILTNLFDPPTDIPSTLVPTDIPQEEFDAMDIIIPMGALFSKVEQIITASDLPTSAKTHFFNAIDSLEKGIQALSGLSDDLQPNPNVTEV